MCVWCSVCSVCVCTAIICVCVCVRVLKWVHPCTMQTFGDNRYLEKAKQCGNVIWERGLLLKGSGICHGVSGNAYAFLKLYQITKHPAYLYRAAKVWIHICMCKCVCLFVLYWYVWSPNEWTPVQICLKYFCFPLESYHVSFNVASKCISAEIIHSLCWMWFVVKYLDFSLQIHRNMFIHQLRMVIDIQ